LALRQLTAPVVTKNHVMDARTFFLRCSFLLRSEVYIQPPYYKSSIEKKIEKKLKAYVNAQEHRV
jgi:hypothetical protein